MRVILLCLSLFSGWREGGVPVCVAPGAQWILDVKGTGGGGVVVLWWDSDEGVKNSFIQVVDSAGNLVFEEPVKVTEDLGYGGEVEVDREGNYWVVLTKARDGDVDVWIQKISPDGRRLFGDEGKVVCDVDGDQRRPHLCVSGDGVYVVWEDYRAWNSEGIGMVYMQRVTLDGDICWDKEGIKLSLMNAWHGSPKILSAFQNGACMFWKEYPDNYMIVRGQRVDSLGNFLWGDTGIVIISYGSSMNLSTGNYRDPFYVGYDGKGNIIVSHFMRAQKVNMLGELLWEGGYEIKDYPYRCADGNGGLFIFTSTNDFFEYPRIMVAHYDSLCLEDWDKMVWQGEYADSNDTEMYISSSLTGSDRALIIGWDYYRTGSILMMKIDRDGNSLWGGAVEVSKGGDFVRDLMNTRVIGYRGGGIIVWQEKRYGDMDIFAGYVDSTGNVVGIEEREEKPEFKIESLIVSDWVRIKFFRGMENVRITLYSIDGRRIREVFRGGVRSGELRIPLSSLPSGVYFLNIFNGDREVVKKVLKVRR